MFGDRCLGLSGCGHSTNWTCGRTCDEVIERDEHIASAPPIRADPPSDVERLQSQIEGMALYVQHGTACDANDFDYLDKTPCTCGLRAFYNPKGQALQQGSGQ